MGSFGQNLRRQRELRGISLDEIAEHTKISARMFEAIEQDRYELLPGGIFNRSFVLHYARYLGLDEAQVCSEFDTAVGAEAPVDLKEIAAQREQHATPVPEVVTKSSSSLKWQRVGLTAVLVLALLLLAGYALKPAWFGRARTTTPPPPSHPVSAPTPVASETAAPPPAATPAGKLHLQVDTVGDSLVEVSADGKKLWSADLHAGETRTVDADARIELRAGNAGVVILTLNGDTQPPLGRKGEMKSVIFTAEDLKKP